MVHLRHFFSIEGSPSTGATQHRKKGWEEGAVASGIEREAFGLLGQRYDDDSHYYPHHAVDQRLDEGTLTRWNG